MKSQYIGNEKIYDKSSQERRLDVLEPISFRVEANKARIRLPQLKNKSITVQNIRISVQQYRGERKLNFQKENQIITRIDGHILSVLDDT